VSDAGEAHGQGLLTCVVDEHPRFHLDALRWYAALTEVAGVAAGDLVVHAVGSDSSDVLDFLRSRGVTVRAVDPFDPRSPHCNKISGALRLAQDPIDGLTVLCDADIVVLTDPRTIDVPPGSVAGKVVDAPVPPLDVVLRVFEVAGMGTPSTVALPWGQDDRTVSGNSNGGLYLIPGPTLTPVATAWAHWAHWLLDRLEMLGQWSVYVDQVAMALALHAEDVTTLALGVEWNTPTHDPSRIPSDPPVPKILHYHQETDELGLIRPTGAGPIDSRIALANDAIQRVWAEAAPVTTYRAWRAQRSATPREDLQAARARVIAAVRPGDVCELEGALDEVTEADLVVSMEELTFPLTGREQRDAAGRLWRAARRALVVRGFGDAPTGLDMHTASGEPLSATLRFIAPDAEVYPIASDGPLTTFVVLRPPHDKHPRDFGSATLATVVARHPDPLTLFELRMHALRTTGFYPDHAPRLWEYPVVVKLIGEHLPTGSRILDVGAGVTPLAPFLAGRGHVVETVDPSPVVRTWPPQPDWNEWDYLDYGAAGLARRSWNCTLDQVPAEPAFDAVYSVSVIEHVPAEARRSLLADIAARTRLDGLVVLTIDLVRGRDDLWNLNLGVEVEALAEHGTLEDVVGECSAVGLETFAQEIVRDWGPDTRVDIGLLALRQTRVPTPVESPASSPSGARWRAKGRRLTSIVRRPGR